MLFLILITLAGTKFKILKIKAMSVVFVAIASHLIEDTSWACIKMVAVVRLEAFTFAQTVKAPLFSLRAPPLTQLLLLAEQYIRCRRDLMPYMKKRESVVAKAVILPLCCFAEKC